jgi:2'-5' RNA ligase
MSENTRAKLDAKGRFASFYGFSLLFDNPGTDNLTPMESPPGQALVKLNNNLREPALELYAGLHKGLTTVGLQALNDGHSFSALDAASYHVTAWDGLNDANTNRIRKEYRGELCEWLGDLPDSLRSGRFTKEARLSSLVGNREIEFRFDKLTVFRGAGVLVALLKAQDGYKQALEEIAQEQLALYASYERTFGLKRPGYPFTPHISLGYFWPRQQFDTAWTKRKDWHEAFAPHAQDCTIRFSSISLYGFLDMETFFRQF